MGGLGGGHQTAYFYIPVFSNPARPSAFHENMGISNFIHRVASAVILGSVFRPQKFDFIVDEMGRASGGWGIWPVHFQKDSISDLR